MRSYYAYPVLAALGLATGCNRTPDAEAGRPNIILIMADDMGYSDLGCFGGEILTPNLDRLAANGIRFTQFYNASRSCPSRASLLTGCYPHQTGIGHMTSTPENHSQHDLSVPGYRGALNQSCVTIAEVLKEAGYSTLMTGKWHLGIADSTEWPLNRGFEKFYGLLPGASNFFKPESPRGITFMNDPVIIEDENYYTTDAFTDYAIRLIGESREESPENPFFLYLAYTAPHWPLHAPPEVVKKYRGKYMNGWAVLRENRFARMKQMGLIDPEWELSPQDSRDWDSLDGERKEEMDLRMAIYAAMIDRMDWNIGRLTGYLEEKGMMENTVIIFLSDNGACAEFAELGSGPAEQLGTEEGYVLSYGQAWANASNTPFREYKHWVHEGGISTPLIVHWPEGIPANRRGKMESGHGILPDIMASCIELAGTEYPSEYAGKSVTALSGKSLVPLLKGEDIVLHPEPVFWEHEGNSGVRLGKYKLVQKWEKDLPGRWELYDMETDRTENNDLSAELPDKVNEMDRMYDEWASTHLVLPWDSVQVLYQRKRESEQKTNR